MLVPSMTLEEIRRETQRDFEIIWRKANYVAQELKRTNHRKLKHENLSRIYDYYSKYKNHWLYHIEIIKKTEAYFNFMCYYYGNRGLIGILLMKDENPRHLKPFIAYCTAHFFKRFNERRKLGLTVPEDILRAFLMDVQAIRVKHLYEFAPDMWEIFCITPIGILLGISNEKMYTYKFNTFLSTDMLRSDQKELTQQISQHLYKYRFSGVWEKLDE